MSLVADEMQLRELFLRCQNRALIAQSEGISGTNASANAAEISYLRISAFVELHQPSKVDEEYERLKSLPSTKDAEMALYAEARTTFFAHQFEEAEQKFAELAGVATSPKFVVRAALGLANCAFLSKNETAVASQIEALQRYEQSMTADERLFALYLRARYDRVFHKNYEASQTLYRDMIRGGANLGFTYFVVHGIYGLALCAKEDQRPNEVRPLLAVLQAMCSPEEMPHVRYQLEYDFADYRKPWNTPIVVADEKTFTVRSNRVAIPLATQPKVFGIIRTLAGNPEKFFTKEELSQILWPLENYHPFVHDPRVFDLMKRTRTKLEVFSDPLVNILSGRMGYKLVIGSDHDRK